VPSGSLSQLTGRRPCSGGAVDLHGRFNELELDHSHITENPENPLMCKPSLYIRAGLKRTATTFIQKSVLNNIQSLKYFPKPSFEVDGQKVSFSGLFQFSPLVWKSICENPFSKKKSIKLEMQ
jgi:hypothetical protein